MNLSVTLAASSPPEPALAPATEIIPFAPPGIFSVTLLFWKYPIAGVKTAVSPSTCQLPAICGESVGIGVLAASGAENCTRIGAAPLTPFVPAAGVTDSTWSGTAGPACRTAAAWAADTGSAWSPGDAKAMIATPASRTTAAPLAISAAARRPFRRDRLGSAAVVPSLSSSGCCLRNHPDRDTAPSPPRVFTIGQL